MQHMHFMKMLNYTQTPRQCFTEQLPAQCQVTTQVQSEMDISMSTKPAPSPSTILPMAQDILLELVYINTL